MAKMEQCILTNMCMIKNGTKILVQNRKDPNWPGITFCGGHIEKRESFVDAVIREVKEETGLDIWNVKLCGLKQFTMKDDSCRYLVFFYQTDCFAGELKSSDEGEVFWIERSELENYEVADGFLEMLEVFENEQMTENYWYLENDEWKMINK